mmetsp:Transcript_3213/g.6614  ORF Transcript_3213/g.6614 Transcript_3213/m.6614 type:complete len:92 (+) Transcript_3213:254-529(+)
MVVLYRNLLRLNPSFEFLKQQVIPKIASNLSYFNDKNLMTLIFYATEPGVFDKDFCELLLNKQKLKLTNERTKQAYEEAKNKFDFYSSRLV